MIKFVEPGENMSMSFGDLGSTRGSSPGFGLRRHLLGLVRFGQALRVRGTALCRSWH